MAFGRTLEGLKIIIGSPPRNDSFLADSLLKEALITHLQVIFFGLILALEVLYCGEILTLEIITQTEERLFGLKCRILTNSLFLETSIISLEVLLFVEDGL